MDLKTKWMIGVVILVMIVVAQNSGPVVFQLFFWQVSMSKVILAPLLMLLGGAIGFVIGRNSWDWES